PSATRPRRAAIIPVRLTESERDQLAEAARDLGLSVSTYMRQVVLSRPTSMSSRDAWLNAGGTPALARSSKPLGWSRDSLGPFGPRSWAQRWRRKEATRDCQDHPRRQFPTCRALHARRTPRSRPRPSARAAGRVSAYPERRLPGAP